jgi:hypothetical protein
VIGQDCHQSSGTNVLDCKYVSRPCTWKFWIDKTEFSYIRYKWHIYCDVLMSSKYTVALYAAIISSTLVASIFAISYVQQAAAQGNQTGGGNKTSGGNQTGGGGNMTAGNMTGAGLATSGTPTGGGGSSGGGGDGGGGGSSGGGGGG